MFKIKRIIAMAIIIPVALWLWVKDRLKDV